MANLLENINQACADFSNIKKAITDKGVEVASGTPSSEYADKVNEVYDAGKAYAYDNPQTPTDGRKSLTYWYAQLNAELGRIWDDRYNEETWELIQPRYDESTWLESLEYPKGTENVEVFTSFASTMIYDELPMYDIPCQIPVHKFVGVLDMSGAVVCDYAFNGSVCNDLGTIILPKSLEVTGMKYAFSWCESLTKVKFVGTIQWDMEFRGAPLDGDTIRHIVSILSDSTTGKKLTLSELAVGAAMPWDLWEELIATKKNWTIALV